MCLPRVARGLKEMFTGVLWRIFANIQRTVRQKCWLESGCGKLHRSSRTALGTLDSNNNHMFNYIETFSATQYFHGNLTVHSNQWSWVTKSIFNPSQKLKVQSCLSLYWSPTGTWEGFQWPFGSLTVHIEGLNFQGF